MKSKKSETKQKSPFDKAMEKILHTPKKEVEKAIKKHKSYKRNNNVYLCCGCLNYGN